MSGPYEVAHDLSPVLLSDTTLRDGTQRESLILSPGDKPRIARRLDAFGMPFVEGGWPGSNPKDDGPPGDTIAAEAAGEEVTSS